MECVHSSPLHSWLRGITSTFTTRETEKPFKFISFFFIGEAVLIFSRWRQLVFTLYASSLFNKLLDS